MEYHYAPLQYPDSIRLLKLHAGETSAPIQITLSEVRSKDNPEYEALSYTWATEDGDDARSSSIECGGRCIWITRNCEAALRRLRNRDTDCTLWVDAICIDQRNISERGHQVGIMRDIYSKATQVLIWLGNSSKDVSGETGLSVSGVYLSYVCRMAAEIRTLRGDRKKGKTSILYQKLLSEVDEWRVTHKASSLVRGLLDIHCRRWWSRIWVLQEVTIAKSAVFICSEYRACHSDICLWHNVLRSDFLRNAARTLYYKMGSSRKHLDFCHHSKQVVNSDSIMSSEIILFNKARYLEASDLRDKIFGVLGLSDTLMTLFPSPDYSKSPSDIFTEVAKAFLDRSRSLRILEEASSAGPALNHPSWVPDWSVPPIKILPYKDHLGFFNACKGSIAAYEISSNSRQLRVKGKEFDRVGKLSIITERVYQNSGTKRKIPGWQKSCQLGLSLGKYPTGEDVREALWRTLCWNRDRSLQYPALSKTAARFEEWYSVLASNRDSDVMAIEMKAQADPFCRLILWKTPLCITRKGFLAAVPYTTKPEDCIAVLAGGRLPFVLRPTGDSYRLIGPCYVHGIMDGEAFPEDPGELEWFSIR
jgi:hypothetical protein